ncbi:type II secretion system protein A [Alteromonadaceae bacterium Bs31]|nr:type II secretion system protein A [Alteromonadaceae bacterium Bs31]
MYHNYFGLQEQAFSIAVNPRYLYMSQQHKEALAHLLYGVKGGGFVLLSGEVGTGKTTIVKCLLEQLPENTDIAIVLNPMADVTDMLCTICEELGAGYISDSINVKELTDALHGYLLRNHTKGHNTVLLIDEAQLLSAEALEQIRLLTNLETNTQKLLQIILVGQPELNELLAQPRMRQLSQRITARFHLIPLTLEETQAYINHRLEVAGMAEGRNPYPPAIVRKIHQFTGGIPRLINIVCERMLIGAYGHNKPVVDQQIFDLARKEVSGTTEHLPDKLINKFDRKILAAAGGAALVVLLGLIWLIVAGTGSEPEIKATAPTETAPATELAPPPTSTSPQPASTTPQPTSTPQTQPAATPAPAQPGRKYGDSRDYRSDSYELAQYNLLTRLGFEVSSETYPCWELTRDRIQCKTVTLDTWEALQEVNRPSVLTLTTPERFTSHIIVTGLGRRMAEVLTPSGETIQVPLSELGPMWTGKSFYVWRRPEGFSETLTTGMNSPTIRWLAEQFAILDERDRPLTDTNFSSKMRERVRIFQRNQGLKDDGIVGEQTLMKVNEVMGIDQTLRLLED